MSEEQVTVKIELESLNEAFVLFGNADIHLKLLEESFNVTIVTRGETVNVSGEVQAVENTSETIRQLQRVIRKGVHISERDVEYASRLTKENRPEFFSELFEKEIARNTKGKAIHVKTVGQLEYIEAIRKKDLVFGIGPAGTGKTYLAVVMAVNALKNNKVDKIILTRPAIEAGESLGFLPGDLKEKVDPYLRPLYDALHDVLGAEHTQRLIDRETIEIAPLAYMRGRTLDNAFVILDEAQNTTQAQMKMFLTRLGFGSKMVLTGDSTQVDLPRGVKSGLVAAEVILKDVSGISFIHLTSTDVVRHPLVGRIIEAYENNDVLQN